MSKKQILDVDSFLKKFDNALNIVSQEVAFEIEQEFESAIESFYSDYPNPIYNRTGNIRNFSTGYNKPPLSIRLGDYKYVAGIKVTPTAAPAGAYAKHPHHGLRVTNSFVYNISYMRGIHGFNRSDLTYKRDKRTGELLRGGKRSDKKAVYRNDNWKPGFKSDMAFTSLLEKADVLPSFNALEGLKNSYARSYYRQHHTPQNSIPPATLMQRGFKDICKSIGVKINKAMGVIF